MSSNKIVLSCVRDNMECIRMELHEESTIDDLLFNFECFLKGMGYFPQGSVEINDDEYYEMAEMKHHYKNLKEENKKLAKKLKKLSKKNKSLCECGDLDCDIRGEI